MFFKDHQTRFFPGTDKSGFVEGYFFEDYPTWHFINDQQINKRVSFKNQQINKSLFFLRIFIQGPTNQLSYISSRTNRQTNGKFFQGPTEPINKRGLFSKIFFKDQQIYKTGSFFQEYFSRTDQKTSMFSTKKLRT